MVAMLGDISPVELSADDPLFRSVVDHAGGLRGLLACPTPGVAEHLIEPLADAVADPEAPSTSVPVTVISAFHGGLLTDVEARRDVARLLGGKAISSSSASTPPSRPFASLAAPGRFRPCRCASTPTVMTPRRAG